jgi:hypothetical protein
MGKKHVNDDKPAGYRGRSVSGSKSEESGSNREGGERNRGKPGSEEHSRAPKGNRGGEKRR